LKDKEDKMIHINLLAHELMGDKDMRNMYDNHVFEP